MGSFWQRSATVGVVVLIICSVVVGFGVVVVFASVVVLSRAVGPAVVEFAVAGDVVDFSDLAPSTYNGHFADIEGPSISQVAPRTDKDGDNGGGSEAGRCRDDDDSELHDN